MTALYLCSLELEAVQGYAETTCGIREMGILCQWFLTADYDVIRWRKLTAQTTSTQKPWRFFGGGGGSHYPWRVSLFLQENCVTKSVRSVVNC